MAEPTREAWSELVRSELRGRDPDSLATALPGGVSLPPLLDGAAAAPGLPGQTPWVRGRLGSRVTLRWSGDPSERRADLAALEDDAKVAVEVRFPAPTDFAAQLQGLDLARPRCFAVERGTPAAAAELLAAVGPEHELSYGIDPLADLTRGAAIDELPGAWDAVATLSEGPGYRLELSSEPWAAAGADEVDELALLTASLAESIDQLEQRGFPVEILARGIALRTTVGRHVLLGVAKLRALRSLWSRVLAAWGVTSNAPPRISAVTHPGMFSRLDPWVNLLRGIHAAFAALVGNADAVEVLPFDHALGQPDPLARRMARNTPVVLALESHLAAVADPAGGAYAFEHLTDQLARAAWARFVQLQDGLPERIVGGLQAELAASFAARRAAIARRKLPITGVSEFAHLGEQALDREPHPQADGWPLLRDSEDFEALRARAASSQPAPSVFLATIGPRRSWTARSLWTRNAFGAGGISVVEHPGATGDDPVAELVAAFAESGCQRACLVASDDTYATHAAAAARALGSCYLAGRPTEEHRAAWSEAGVTRLLHVGVDLVELLSAVLDDLTGRTA